MYRSVRIVIALCVVTLLGSCERDPETASRPFRMGFAPFPYQISVESRDYVSGKLAVEADIINHHFDGGVPWGEALANAPFPEEMVADWALRKSLAEAGHKIYVSVTPINAARNGLASYRGAREYMPLPAPWHGYTFGDEAVRNAYVRYCKRVIDYFHPDYFAMSMEANLLYRNNPEAWSDYLGFHAHVYRALKAAYPALPIFTSLAGALLLPDFVEGNDHVMQRLASMQLLEMSDYYAVTFYPLASYQASAETWPESTFDELFSLSTKPIIVAETAFTAERVAMPTAQGLETIETNPVRQKLFVDALLDASAKWKAEFVIWYTLRDFEAFETHEENASILLRRNAGFYDDEGNPRPALNTWRDYFRRMVEERTR